MSVCSPCLKVCNVPLCTEEIIIGTISSVDTDIKIIVENKTKGSKKIVSTQSDNAGLVTLVTSGLGLMPDQTYEISVILADATALCVKETIFIGDAETKCINLMFENIKDGNGCQTTFESQTLQEPPGEEPQVCTLTTTQLLTNADLFDGTDWITSDPSEWNFTGGLVVFTKGNSGNPSFIRHIFTSSEQCAFTLQVLFIQLNTANPDTFFINPTISDGISTEAEPMPNVIIQSAFIANKIPVEILFNQVAAYGNSLTLTINIENAAEGDTFTLDFIKLFKHEMV